ncbi:MAG: KEOPS complex kinase/ATPase Bud32 [Candidatus Bathyarchaeota archaeon]|nr:KEOPS complex kinase/ATPase Bud32 [Candidatus Bathyarchaeota archaeon]
MLIRKGAEASLYLEEWHSRKVILKKRLSKRYRVPELDREIQLQRTRHEPQIINRAKKAGVPAPVIFMVDLAEAAIVMEFVEGKQVKQVLNGLQQEERVHLCRRIGRLVGRLHSNGIIHGDLTTSNLILTPQGKIVFLDFGLSEQTGELEARGVDLHLMKRALNSTHYRHAGECFGAIMEGYKEVMGDKAVEEVSGKIEEIEKRGRYISER